MTSVIWHATISLDGFLAGPGGDMSWMTFASGANPLGWELVPRIGAIVAGRRTHDLGLAGDGAGAYGGSWQGPIVVPTSRPAEASPHPDVVFVAGGAGGGGRGPAAPRGGGGAPVRGGGGRGGAGVGGGGGALVPRRPPVPGGGG